ncbi:TRAP transporter small permease [Flavilitoribacter nigricans]|uniref:Tripartite ATP-independent periplasmic transporters DctQ component domain-containing protein n=1 Tax=Flavilitoribacter nigricans (strain ATCC 23147 / DSM 23189 / NBRC 102662 / NCIMB 1420 / SS-2) TaxID=1122177 RepID=A0A2D0N2W6_FLAN2|nr:TRAP transporter small permease subunit [Flavilitoribacter nigricans]PHN02738.1 hypothetical protein CRP01_30610 [Flavilitoribacter nigricans DSM 23189 = NBRC 102662]
MKQKISTYLKYGTLLSAYGFIGSVLLQIFARFFLANTPPWTEEVARLCFIYAIAFAAGLALKQQYYVHLDVLFNRLPATFQRRLLLIIPAATLLLFAVLGIFAIPFILRGYQEFSPSMQIRMAFVFFSMLVLGASMSYYAALDLRKAIKNHR